MEKVFPRSFLWGGAAQTSARARTTWTAAGWRRVDVMPHGKDRFPVGLGLRKMLDFEDGYFYPRRPASTSPSLQKEDIALFAEMASRPSA